MTLDFLTILHGDQLAAKQVNRSSNDGYDVLPAGTSFGHSVASVSVTSLSDLHQALSNLQSDAERFVIRGNLIEGRPTKGIRRTLRPKMDEPANFVPASHRWVMLDIDDVSLPEGLVDPNTQADDIVGHVISLLPAEFQQTSCVYQWSGSMGFKMDLIRVHLWFWLDKAVSDVELKNWLHDAPVDHALFNPVQVHYTANPILAKDISDPIKNRLGLYTPKDGKETVLVPNVIAPRHHQHTAKPAQFVSSDATVDPQGIIRDAKSGLVIDGRERFLLFKSNDAMKELMRGNSDRRNDPGVETIANRTWELFSAEADLSDGKWSYDDAFKEAQRRHEELLNDEYDFISRNDTTLLEPCSSPYLNLELVSKAEGQDRLDAALSKFFRNIDEGPRVALRITTGAGKTRATIRKLQSYLKEHSGQIVEIYVPRHDLAEQYVKDIGELPDGFCANVVHVLGRYQPSVSPETRPDLCQRRDYVESLTKAGLGIFNHACLSSDGERCDHYDSCPYIQQFKAVDFDFETRGNVVRILPHSYLGLARNPIQKRNMPNLVIIDEAFIDELIDTKTELSPSDIKKHIKTDQHPKLGRSILDALEDKEPLLEMLRDEGITMSVLKDVNLDHLKPSLAFAPNQTKKIKPSGDAKLYRSLLLLLTILKEEMSLAPPRADVERVIFNPYSETVRLSYLKEVEFPSTTPILCLDATADEVLLEEVFDQMKVERIDVSQKAIVTQVYDSTGSKQFWNGSTAPVQQLVNVAKGWADLGETPLIVCHKELADRLKSCDDLKAAIKVMHFGSLRGSNEAEECSVIFITGRNLPQMAEIDLKARALFWAADIPLQHDQGSQFKDAENSVVRPVEQLRGFIQSHRNSHPQSGVRVMSFSDERIDRLLAQTRDAETLQALGRLRLVHSPYQKRVFLLNNLPVEMPVDKFAKLNDLMPDRLEQELLKFGNIPLSPLGMQKMRPDIGQSEHQTAKLLQRSKVRDSARLAAMHDFVRYGMFIVTFEGFNAGRWNTHEHLFLLRDFKPERPKEAPYAQLGTASIPFDEWVKYLEEGDAEVAGSTGWGTIRDPRYSYAS